MDGDPKTKSFLHPASFSVLSQHQNKVDVTFFSSFSFFSLLFLSFLFFLFNVCMVVLFVCVSSTMCVPGALRSQKTVSNLLQLQTVCAVMWMQGREPGTSGRVVSVPNQRQTSLQPPHSIIIVFIIVSMCVVRRSVCMFECI